MTESVAGDLADIPPGPALSALLYRFDLDRLTAEQAIPVLKAWSRQRAHDHARLARTLVRVAALSRHATGPVGDWAGSEIAAALTWSESKAAREVEFAETLATLPQVAAAFDAGGIDHGKAWVFTDVLGSTDLTQEQIDALCAAFVPLAPGLTAGQLRHRLVRAILAVDPEWAGRRYRRAVAGRRVCGYLCADGTATIAASGLPTDEAAAACARVDALAEQLVRAGYPGTVTQIRAEVFLRLLDGRLTGLANAEIITTLLADAKAAADPAGRAAADQSPDATAGAPEEGEPTPTAAGPHGEASDGESVDDPYDSGGPTTGQPSGRSDGVDPEPAHRAARGVDPKAAHRAAPEGIEIGVGLCTLLGLDRRPGEIAGWGPVLPEVARAVVARHRRARWRFAIVDDSGHLLLAGTTRHRPLAAEPVTGQAAVVQAEGGVVELHVSAHGLLELAARPDAHPAWAPLIADLARRFADRHRLLAALDAHPDARLVRGALLRHLQVRDRGCVAPGCRRPARVCDADHTIAHAAGGPTSAANVGPLCPRHHALKHLAGWRLTQPAPGQFHWISPLGEHYDTRGEPIMTPLPDPLPRPPAPERAPGSGPPEVDGPTFDPTPKARPRPPGPPPPRWRPSHHTPEDPDDPAPF